MKDSYEPAFHPDKLSLFDVIDPAVSAVDRMRDVMRSRRFQKAALEAATVTIYLVLDFYDALTDKEAAAEMSELTALRVVKSLTMIDGAISTVFEKAGSLVDALRHSTAYSQIDRDFLSSRPTFYSSEADLPQ